MRKTKPESKGSFSETKDVSPQSEQARSGPGPRTIRETLDVGVSGACAFDCSTRYRRSQVKTSEALVEFVDLVPTILEELKVSGITGLQGKSFVPVINGKTQKHRDSVFSEYLVDNRVMLRTTDWKYVFTTGKADLGLGYSTGNPPPGITHALYDLKLDPGETRNLASDPKHKARFHELQQALLSRFKETHPLAKDLPTGASVEEALVWFCEPPDAKVSLVNYKF